MFPLRLNHPNTLRWTNTAGFAGPLQVEIIDNDGGLLLAVDCTVGPAPGLPEPAQTAVAVLSEAQTAQVWPTATHACLMETATRAPLDLAPLTPERH